jgi:hypothetical protein
LVEFLPSKQAVAGSSPVSRSKILLGLLEFPDFHRDYRPDSIGVSRSKILLELAEFPDFHRDYRRVFLGCARNKRVPLALQSFHGEFIEP